MANYLIFDGDSYAHAPTLGNLLNATASIRVVSNNVSWASTTGYLWSQAASSSREFGLWRSNGGLRVYLGGSDYEVLTAAEVTTEWGSSTITGQVELLIETSNQVQYDLTIKHDGTTVGGLTGVSPALTRVDGCLFRFGARADDNASGSTGSAYVIASGDTVGDTDVYIDGTLTRRYVMPSTGTTIPDTQNTQDATVVNSAGDDSEWGDDGAGVTEGLPAYTLHKDGATLGNLTNVKVRVTATSALNGTQYYYSETVSATAGVLPTIDLSATAAAVNDTVTVEILTGANEGAVFEDTVEDIS